MYKAIMVALANSHVDQAALNAGIRLARASAARLHIVHVRIRTGISANDEEQTDFSAATKWAADELDESVSFRMIEPPGGRSRPKTIAKHLIGYANENQIDLIVLGTHARSRLERSILGSVGDGLIHGTHLPILLIPRADGRAATQKLRFKRVLVPLDGTAAAEQILPDAIHLAQMLNGSIALLQVVSPEPNASTGPLAHEEFVLRSARSEEYLDRVAEELREKNVEVETLTLAGEFVTPVIRRAAVVRRVDVVALATRGLPPFSLLLQSGISDDLIDGARLPLLIRRQEASTETGTKYVPSALSGMKG
jgi:nucleotide-binding universal stress UspA family protein